MSECAASFSGRHVWVRDDEFRREGLICEACGVTEAELEKYAWRDDE